MCGLVLDDWQQMVLDGALMECTSPGGVVGWGAFEVGVVVPRQNGKGSILEARQLAGLFLLGERLQIHTAHEFKTCFEHFRRVKDLVETHPKLASEVRIIRTGAGDQAIELKNGNRIRFLARSRTSGRGFSADVVYLDEAFELSDATMGALLPALSARPNPQIWYTSSAPHADSEVLHRLRSRGHAASDEQRLFFAEWCNEPDADPTDVEAWRRANPSLGIRIDPSTIDNEQRSMSPAEFARERLGIPEEPESTSSVIPLEQWDSMEDKASESSGRTCLALDVSPDRKWASICEAGRREDGLIHLEVVDRRPSTGWVVDALPGLLVKAGCESIRIEKGGPAASLISQLAEAGVKVDEISSADHARATGQMIDFALAGSLRHLGQQTLRSAVAGATLRASGDAELWSRRSSKVDVSPLVACTLALGGVPDVGESAPFFVY